MVIGRFDVCLVNLDPTLGHEIKKARPGLIVSPDEMNRHIRTVIIAPMTAAGRDYPTRISVSFEGKKGQIALDRLRTVDKRRLVKVREKSMSRRPSAFWKPWPKCSRLEELKP